MSDDSGEELELSGFADPVMIGRGGYAVVYRALQTRFDRLVAIKVFDGLLLETGTVATFERECKAIGRLSGRANILTVYDAGISPANRPYLVMAYMAGGSLERKVSNGGSLPWPDATTLAIKLAKALDAAHSAAVLHRDVKPENVLLSDDGEPFLADFGISRLTDATKRTRTDLSFTPAHVAPEIVLAGEPTKAVDIYSLASTLFELMAGRPAFVSNPDDNILAVLNRIVHDPLPDLLRPRGVPEPVCRVVESAMAKDPLDRPPTAGDLARQLEVAVQRANAAHVSVPRPVVPRQAGTVLINESIGRPDTRPEPAEAGSTSPSTTPPAGWASPAISRVSPPPPPPPPSTVERVGPPPQASPPPTSPANRVRPASERAEGAQPTTHVLPPPAPPAPPPLQSPPPSPGTIEPGGPPKSSRRTAMVVALVVAAGVIVAVVLILATRKSSGSSTLAPPTTVASPSTSAPPTSPATTATTVSTATTTPPSPPTTALVSLAPSVTSANGPPVQQALLAYFTAINNHDWQGAWEQLTANQQALNSPAKIAQGAQTTHDSNVVVNSVTPESDGSNVAAVTFTSMQAPVDSPNGQTCDVWTLNYRMVPAAQGFLIDTVQSPNPVPYRTCPAGA